MEIAIGFCVGVVIALLMSGKKKRHKHKPSPSAESERRRRQQTDEEIITVVLPTIDNDK